MTGLWLPSYSRTLDDGRFHTNPLCARRGEISIMRKTLGHRNWRPDALREVC